MQRYRNTKLLISSDEMEGVIEIVQAPKNQTQ